MNHKDDNLIFKSILLSIYICYFLRTPTKDEKDKLYDELSLLLQKLGKKMIKQKQYMRGMINNEMVQLANHISFPEGIEMNTGLQENIFALFNYIINKVPIFICSEPGCSKTLSFELLKDNLQGLKSKDDYFRHYHQFYLFISKVLYQQLQKK